MNSYVYIYFHPNGIPCYVGKGKGSRINHAVDSHNKQLRGICRVAGGSLPVVIIRDNLSNKNAFEIEIALIKAIGRIDLGQGPLVNHTDGGDGIPNMTEEIRDKIRRRHLGRKHTERAKANMSLAQRGRTDDRMRAVIAMNIARQGTKHSAESIERMRAAHKKRDKISLETRAKLTAALKERHRREREARLDAEDAVGLIGMILRSKRELSALATGDKLGEWL